MQQDSLYTWQSLKADVSGTRPTLYISQWLKKMPHQSAEHGLGNHEETLDTPENSVNAVISTTATHIP